MQGAVEEGERVFREATRLARRGIGKSDPHIPAAHVNYARFLRNGAIIPTLVQSVRPRLRRQGDAHALLLEAAKILSKHGPESLSSECQSDDCHQALIWPKCDRWGLD